MCKHCIAKCPPVFRITDCEQAGRRTLTIPLMRGGKITLKLSAKAWAKLSAITKAE